MKDLDVTPFEPEDIEEIVPREIDKEWNDVLSDSIEIERISRNGLDPAYTARLDGRVVFCGGITVLWEGVGEIWSLVDERATHLSKEIYIWQKQLLETQIKKGIFNRLQAHVAKKWPSACRFVEHLGFTQEAVLRKYGVNGDDYILYGRVF